MLRSVYDIDHDDTDVAFVAQLGVDLQDDTFPPEVQQLGRTIMRWQSQIVAWHRCRHTNGPTEAIMNNLVERVKRAFGMTNWINYRTCALLYAGRPTGHSSTQEPTPKSEAPDYSGRFTGVPAPQRDRQLLQPPGVKTPPGRGGVDDRVGAPEHPDRVIHEPTRPRKAEQPCFPQDPVGRGPA